MKRTTIAVLALVLTGCQPAKATLSDAQDECWRVSRAMMRSPSTAKLVDATESQSSVVVTLDAANSYGAPVKTKVICQMGTGDRASTVDGALIDGEPVAAGDLVKAKSAAMHEYLSRKK